MRAPLTLVHESKYPLDWTSQANNSRDELPAFFHRQCMGIGIVERAVTSQPTADKQGKNNWDATCSVDIN